MLADKGYHNQTFKDVWITPINSVNTQVTVVAKPEIKPGIFVPLLEESFHKHFSQAVEFIKTRRSLPSTAPD